MCLKMDNQADTNRLFDSLSELVKETKTTNERIHETNLKLEKIGGELNLANLRIDNIEEHKIDKEEISQLITSNFKLHETECSTRNSRGESRAGIFKGTSAANKSLLIGAFVSFLSVLGMYIKSDMEIRNLEAKAKVENIQNEADK